MKAKSVFVCIFTNQPPSTGGAYAIESLPSTERNLYKAVSAAAVDVMQQGFEGTVLSVCNAQAPQFQQFLSTATKSLPFVAIAGTFPDGSQRYYSTKVPAEVPAMLRAMWAGEFGGTGIPTNPGDSNGGWGDGDSLLCRIFPPVCALGFLPWLALAAFTTYRAAEARSGVGRAVWGVPAFLFWHGFLAKGGMKQIQWWVKNGGIGALPNLKISFRNEMINNYGGQSDQVQRLSWD